MSPCDQTLLNTTENTIKRTSAESGSSDNATIVVIEPTYLKSKSAISVERSENASDQRERIWKKFKGKCVHCFGPADHVHHITPRSRGMDSWPDEELVPLCHEIHQAIHASSPDTWKATLYAWRERALEFLYV